MTREIPPVISAVARSAPDVLPDQDVGRDIDQELVDLLCEDRAWLEETFRDIVATSWAEPPRGGTARPAARPRRYGVPGARAERRSALALTRWWAPAFRRQRSPPGAS